MLCPIRCAEVAAWACLLLATAGCARPPATSQPSPAGRGLTFTIRMAGTSFGGRPSRVDSISTQFLDGVLRVDLPSRGDAGRTHGRMPGFYLLVQTAAKTTTVVMPQWKQYWVTRFDSAAGRGGQTKTIVSDIDVSAHRVGGGETVNGYAATHYRIETRYTETPTNGSNGARRKKVHLVEDVWVPGALSDVPDPMQAYLRLVASSATVGELAEKQGEARRKLFEGLPIRMTWLVTQTFDGATPASRTLTIDVLDLKRANLDRMAFRVPDGYRRLDMAALLNAADLLMNGPRNPTKESAKGTRPPER